MKNKYILFILLLASSLSFGQAKDWEFLPPFNFQVDSTTLLATWEAPKIVLLNEDFEGDDFPPEGWADTSLGAGWMQTSDPDFWFWHFPLPEGSFALVNDDLIYSNNGSLDYLITPSLDLTVADSFYLVFDSYFDGGYGQQAFIEYSLDSGTTWQMLHQMDASLAWENVSVNLSDLSGTEGESNILISFHADDNGYFASGWAIDNVMIYSDDIQDQILSYYLFLETGYAGQSTCCDFQYYFDFTLTHSCGILAHYQNGNSDTIWQTVHSSYLPKPIGLSGFAPDFAAILTWSPPWVPSSGGRNNRDVGDIIDSFPAPSPILCYGICDDGSFLWVSDADGSATTIYQMDHEGNSTGETITISLGQSWIGDMVSDGQYLYACLVGGPNSIVKVELATGATAGTIVGAFTVTSQRGLAADFVNEEFYIGGWNSDQIWRTTFEGNTISTFGVDEVSGLAWHNTGGPEAEGSLWVVSNTSSSLISEIDPNDGWITYQSFTIPGEEQFSGAGMEVKTNGENCGSLWICNQVENTIYLVDVDEPLAVPCTSGSSIPENLLGFNLYKNDEFLDYMEYTDPDSCGYVDPISWAEYYEGSVLKYEITAVYDMTPYGFPGETGESLPDGPAEVILFLYWLELDFLEDWSAGTFDDNAWYVTDSNWTVSQDIGNEAPCAVFVPDTVMTGYSDALQSFHFLEHSSVDIILEFDVALSSINPTGNEKLQIQVFDYTNRNWNTVSTISNVEGSFDWRNDSLNIAGAFNQGAFRIRFNAIGENSSDINYWAVDNIALTWVCPAPGYIEADLKPPSVDSVLVSWEEPIQEIADWWQYDDGLQYTKFGFGVSKNDWFSFAIRWSPEQLLELKGASLTAIGFIPGEGSAFYKIAAWQGEEKELVHVQAAGNLVIDQWNIIPLDAPVEVDITRDLLVGYRLAEYMNFPISVDDGPAVDGYSNLLQFGLNGGWQTFLENGYNYNWNIKAYFERDGVQYESYYRVFRSIDGSEPEMIAEIMENEFTDPVSADTGLYCYKVKALYYNGCESVFSPEACILLTETPSIDYEVTGTLKIYPNPSSDVLFIESSENMQSISIYDGKGEKVIRWEGDKGKVEVPVDGLVPGLYLVKVETEGEMIVRKVVVRR